MKKILLLTLLTAFSISSYAQVQVQGIITDYYSIFTGRTTDIDSNFNGYCFSLKINDTYTIVDTSGVVLAKDIKVMGSLMSQRFNIFNNTYAEFDNKKFKYRFVNLKEKTKTDFIYNDYYVFPNNTFIASAYMPKGDDYMYFDENMKVFSSFDNKFYSVVGSLFKSYTGQFNDGLARLKFNRGTKYINEKGEVKIDTEYIDGSDFSEGRAVVGRHGAYGYMDKTGKLVIDLNYSKIPYLFKGGIAKVQNKNSKYGFINKNADVVIEPIYEYATCFYKEHALVRQNYKSPILLINKKGEVITTFDPKFTVNFNYHVNEGGHTVEIENLNRVNTTLKELMDYKKGIFNGNVLLNIDGSVVLDDNYSELKDYRNGFMLATKKEGEKIKQGLINEKGEFVVEVVDSQF